MVDPHHGFGERMRCFLRHVVTDRQDQVLVFASQAKVLVNLGDVHQAASSAQAARETWQQALEILDDLHHQDADQVRARLRVHPASATVPAGPGTGRGRQARGRAVGGIATGSRVSPVR